MKNLLKFTILFIILHFTNVVHANELKDFVGDWVGVTNEHGRNRNVEVVLWSDAPDNLKGITYYPAINCAGRLIYKGVKNGKQILSEVIFTHSPGCLSGARILASITPEKRLQWIWNGKARGVLEQHTVSADAKQYALGERTGKSIPTQHANNKSTGKSKPAIETTVKHKSRITSPAGYYAVNAESLRKIKTLRYEKKENKYVIDLIVLDAIDPLFKVGERSSHAAWYLSSQQLHITDIAKVPGLQHCNFWTKLYWTFSYEQVQPNVWKEVNKFGTGRKPDSYCKDIQIEPDTCKWYCERMPPPPKPDAYLVKGLAEAKNLYSKIAKPKIVRRNMQEHDTRRSSRKDPWQEHWNQRIRDARDNVIDNW